MQGFVSVQPTEAEPWWYPTGTLPSLMTMLRTKNSRIIVPGSYRWPSWFEIMLCVYGIGDGSLYGDSRHGSCEETLHSPSRPL